VRLGRGRGLGFGYGVGDGARKCCFWILPELAHLSYDEFNERGVARKDVLLSAWVWNVIDTA
jgi:hypothetical protein